MLHVDEMCAAAPRKIVSVQFSLHIRKFAPGFNAAHVRVVQEQVVLYLYIIYLGNAHPAYGARRL